MIDIKIAHRCFVGTMYDRRFVKHGCSIKLISCSLSSTYREDGFLGAI